MELAKRFQSILLSQFTLSLMAPLFNEVAQASGRKSHAVELRYFGRTD
jgi:hypothetical protein